MSTPTGSIVRTGLTISHYWGQEPRWFFKQPHTVQSELIAHYNLAHYKKETIDKKKRRYNLNKIKKAQKRFANRGSDGKNIEVRKGKR